MKMKSVTKNDTGHFLDLTGVSDQEIFNKAYLKMKEQDFVPAYITEKLGPITGNRIYCVYLAEDQKRCAIGHLFPDDLMDKLKDKIATFSGGVYELITYGYIKCENSGRRRPFLETLQRCHDTPVCETEREYKVESGEFTPEQVEVIKSKMRYEFALCADTFGLKIPE